MKKTQVSRFTKIAAAILMFIAAFVGSSQAQTTIAQWTFETSQPVRAAAAGVFTNIAAEVGTGTASALHAGSATYSSTSGNGSAHSMSSALWAVGDFYQFAVSTVGNAGISISWDQTASNTGPKNHKVQYSTDGVNFTDFGSSYALTNGTWNPTTATNTTSYAADLSSVTALNNAATVYFRLVNIDTVAENGTTVGTAGTCRVDNFTVTSSGGGGSPSITTVAASPVAGTSATLNASVIAGTAAVNVYFQYGLTTSYGSVTTTNQYAANTSSVTVSNLASGLSASTTYHFRAVAANSFGTFNGADLTLVTTGIVGTNGYFYAGPGFATGTYNLTFMAVTNQVYSVWSTTNVTLPTAQWHQETDLATGNMTMFETTHPPGLSSYSFTVQPPASGPIFYRVHLP